MTHDTHMTLEDPVLKKQRAARRPLVKVALLIVFIVVAVYVVRYSPLS